jgi:hypothetical protein
MLLLVITYLTFISSEGIPRTSWSIELNQWHFCQRGVVLWYKILLLKESPTLASALCQHPWICWLLPRFSVHFDFFRIQTPVLYSGSNSKPCDFCWAFPLGLILVQVFKISTSLFAIKPWCNFKQIIVVQLFWGKIFYLFDKQYFIHKLFPCLIYQFKMILLYHDFLFSNTCLSWSFHLAVL